MEELGWSTAEHCGQDIRLQGAKLTEIYFCCFYMQGPDQQQGQPCSVWETIFMGHSCFWSCCNQGINCSCFQTVFPSNDIQQTALGGRDTVSLQSKTQICLQSWKAHMYLLSQKMADMLTDHYKRFQFSKLLNSVLSYITTHFVGRCQQILFMWELGLGDLASKMLIIWLLQLL